ncbi:Tlg2-vesicle protein [Ceratobasidium sp. UAMH 11750]|nr:Tlg2-vesicle protein [Ceratobasidium sp. UAMH 11750]
MQSNLSTYPPQPAPPSTTLLSPAPSYNAPPRFASPYSGHSASNGANPFAGPYPTIKRSRSPTPSEAEELKQLDGIIQRALRKESWKDREFVVSMVVFVVIIAIVIAIAVFQDQIVLALTPAAEWVRQQPAGFLIPIAFLIVLSIPPLFGAEIIHLFCGFIYGLGVGFAIVCVGTIIGESLTYFGFRYCFRARGEKMEKGSNGSLRWPSLARVMREGGFIVAVIVRYSAIPTHVTTALFSVCGINYWVFLGSLVLSLPRQIAGVYIGVLALDQANGTNSKTDKKISMIVLGITIAITIFAMRWILRKQRAAGLAIIRERRAALNVESYPGVQPSGSASYSSPNSQAKTMESAPQFPTPVPAPAHLEV